MRKLTKLCLRFPVLRNCLKWVFQVCFRMFLVGRDSLEVKQIIKVKVLRIIAATTGRFYEWVSVFLEKHPKNVSCGTLSMVVALIAQGLFMFIFVKKITVSFVI